MLLCAAIGASAAIPLAAREPLLLGLLGAAFCFFGAVIGYVIENARGPAKPARDRWLAWICAIFWGALGAFGAFYVPRLQPLFDSFGSGLPTSTQLLLRGRPVFMLICAAALAGSVFLTLKPPEPSRRKMLWVCAGAALLAAYWTIAALFAPMFMGSLAGPG